MRRQLISTKHNSVLECQASQSFLFASQWPLSQEGKEHGWNTENGRVAGQQRGHHFMGQAEGELKSQPLIYPLVRMPSELQAEFLAGVFVSVEQDQSGNAFWLAAPCPPDWG